MIGKSKISIIDKHRPTIDIKIVTKETADLFGGIKVKIEYKKIPNTIVREGEPIGLISYNFYTHKEGGFYLGINFKNKTFFIDENDVIFEGVLIPNKLSYENRTPTFEDCIEIKFSLDDL